MTCVLPVHYGVSPEKLAWLDPAANNLHDNNATFCSVSEPPTCCSLVPVHHLLSYFVTPLISDVTSTHRHLHLCATSKELCGGALMLLQLDRPCTPGSCTLCNAAQHILLIGPTLDTLTQPDLHSISTQVNLRKVYPVQRDWNNIVQCLPICTTLIQNACNAG